MRFPDIQIRPEIADIIDKPWQRWFLKPVVDILVVADGSIGLGAAGFALGTVIDTLESSEFYNWVRFRITGATREGSPSINSGATSKQFTYQGFRFDMAGFNLSDYDQVWLFGIRPSVHNPEPGDDAQIENASNKPLSDNELSILAQWMDDEQGGVFATGDHGLLGASMCHKVPRVRNMREWTVAQGVPSQIYHDRKDTNQRAPGQGAEIPFGAQSDDVPQPIEVVKRLIPSAFVFEKRYAPHPILCGMDGVIDVLPDHPHEGEVHGRRYNGVGGQPIDLNEALPFDHDGPEYPDGVNGHPRPEPEVIAIGHPTTEDIPHSKDKIEQPGGPDLGGKDTSPFGLISVYDGEKAGVGRVVVDSTWHHWFNVNLQGFPSSSSAFRKIRNYFKNVAVWLSRKNLRNKMLTAASWNVLVINFDPMRFTAQGPIWFIGQEARDVLGRNASECTIREWIIDLVPELEREIFFDIPFPCLSCPPFEAFEMAVLGGVFKRLSPLVERYRGVEQIERQLIDVKEIGKNVTRGAREGVKAFNRSLAQSLKRTQRMAEALAEKESSRDAAAYTPPIEQIDLSIRLDAILLNHPVFEVLMDRQREVALYADVRVNGLQVERKGEGRIPAEGSLKLEPFDRSDALFAEVNELLIRGPFQEGERVDITLALVTGDRRSVIWHQQLTGAPTSWRQQSGPDITKCAQQSSPVAVWLTIE